jgi:hypothetical protein
MEAPEFFDDASFSGASHSDEPSSSPNNNINDDSNANGSHDQVNSLHIGVNDVDIDDFSSTFDVILCLHDNCDNFNHPAHRDDQASILSIADHTTVVDSIKYVNQGLTPRIQVDGGADRSITPHRELVHNFRYPDPSIGDKTHINDAGVHSHQIVGYGNFWVRCMDSSSRECFIDIPCAYIPSIPSTLLTFRTMPRLLNVTEISNIILGVGAANLTLLDGNDDTYNLVVPLQIMCCCGVPIKFRLIMLVLRHKIWAMIRFKL